MTARATSASQQRGGPSRHAADFIDSIGQKSPSNRLEMMSALPLIPEIED
jgi:hypothetical protein